MMQSPAASLFHSTSFSDPTEERQFLWEYHNVALSWGFSAAIAVAAIFVVFGAVAFFTEDFSSSAMLLRGFLAAFSIFVAYLLRYHREFCRERYEAIASLMTVVTLGGCVLMPHLPAGEVSPVAATVSPAVIVGLFMHYSSIRLSLFRSAVIGWGTSVFGASLAPMVVGGNETVRTLIYLAFTNVMGMIICRHKELRERDLYLQRREAERARAEAREHAAAAEEASRQKTRLIAAVSHDLRQPMTAAVAHLDLVVSRLDRDDREGAKVQAVRAEVAVGVLGDTLDHLLTAARYDSGTEAIEIEVVDLVPMLRRLREDYEPDAVARGIELRLRLPRRRVLVRSDAHSLHRVLGNLISNALKFTDSKGRRGRGVVIRARFRGDRCRIDIVDTGLGIAPESQQLIWEPYVQIDNAERNRERGLGLGLFLVRSIVEQLPGHELTMYSRPGRGSRFSVELPALALSVHRVAPVRTGSAGQLQPADRKALRGGYVLLLEDDHEARLSLQDLFDEWGLLHASGATMRELLASHEDSERVVDAIVCDYRLPGGVNGIDCVAQLRDRLGYSPRAVVITGEPDVEAVRARAGSDTTVLHKPFTIHSLAAPLVEAVRSMRLAEGLAARADSSKAAT